MANYANRYLEIISLSERITHSSHDSREIEEGTKLYLNRLTFVYIN